MADLERPTAGAATTPPEPGFGLYVHWPFCKAKCPYCDFNSHVRPSVDQARWARALTAEMDHYAREAGERCVTSVFFGGGTPSLMTPQTVGAVLEAAAARFTLADDVEITLEANPTSAEAENFAGYRAAGVNRLSLGVQALDDASLSFLGRQHSVAEALDAVRLARRSFDRYSFDIMTARPGQTPDGARDELHRALDEAAEHISIYQLTVEPGTPFEAAWRRGDLPMPDEDTAGTIFDATQRTLTEAGLPAYEVSNHARPGSECRHNLTYWRYGDYVGIGPGAHGRLTLAGEKMATRQHGAPEVWLDRVERHGHATAARNALTPAQRRDELLMMGLRLREGVHRAAFRRELGSDGDSVLPGDAVAALRDAGYIARETNRIVATEAGRTRLNGVLGYILDAASARDPAITPHVDKPFS